MSNHLARDRPVWRLRSVREAQRDQRERSFALLESDGHLGLFDVRNFYPSVRPALVAAALAALPANSSAARFVVGWLEEYEQFPGCCGLPIGHPSSRLVADALLAPLDALIEEHAVEFVRWSDDTRIFPRYEQQFWALADAYRCGLAPLGLALNDAKTLFMSGPEAEDRVANLDIDYSAATINAGGAPGKEMAVELFIRSLDDPVAHRAGLRYGLAALTNGRPAREPFDALGADPELLRVAPLHYAAYLHTLVDHPKGRKTVCGFDWFQEQLSAPIDEHSAWRTYVLLRALDDVGVPPSLGNPIFELATRCGSWMAPVRAAAASVWGGSQSFKATAAMEQIEHQGDLTTRRAFAVTLAGDRNQKRWARWPQLVRSTSSELEPTARWLEAA
ncbi:MAG: reverse transcriptase domain-containing protein [Acidimicrobiales bacterium]